MPPDIADPASAQPTEPIPDVMSKVRFPVVGLGASAGGLQALTRFFEHMPADNGMAFVVVLHLSPTHESHVAAILQRVTRMPVQQVTQQLQIEPEHVYVIPPRHSFGMRDNRLLLVEEERTAGRNVAIDTFFRVLAGVHGAQAISVVLSGTGSDGAVGLARIKEEGGVTFAQAPADAEQQGMPLAAIATGMVDFVLPVADMPAKLVLLAANASLITLPRDIAPAVGARPPGSAEEESQHEAALIEIMALLRSRTRHDFRHYKRPTVLRRLERRMQVTATPTLAAYCDYLRSHAEETTALLQDMLISVTHFFRDLAAWDVLEHNVLPGLFKRLGNDRGLRAWVVGCATGEEAYSLAMLLHEAGQQFPDAPAFQVFATDIDERALDVGRSGLYPSAIGTDVAPARLRSFLAPHHNHQRVSMRLRERVLFAHHNVLSDPPFSRVDLILCRNLFIYLNGTAQDAVLDTFRFALTAGGALFLGSSETADSGDGPFVAIDKKHRLYRLRSSAHGRPPELKSSLRPEPAAAPSAPRPPSDTERHERAREALAPPSVLVDASQRILHLAPDMSRFLQAPEGVPSQQLQENVQPALRSAVRTAIFQALPAHGSAPRLTTAEGVLAEQRVRVTARPLQEAGEEALLLLVSFEELGPAPTGGGPAPDKLADGSPNALHAEYRRLQLQLQQVVEQADASSEELTSSNEELQALNEELRSATEELETSREELQSTNEELTTVNSELAARVDDTSRVNDDLQNLINSSDIATVFVDRGMNIKRYTPPARELFNLIPHDVGRSLLHITHRLQYPGLLVDAQTAFETLHLVEREVQGEDGRTFVVRVLPYRTAEDVIDGAIMSFVDITALRRAQRETTAGAEQLSLAVETTRDFAVVTTDEDGRITAWNRGAERLFGWTPAETVGQPLAMIFTEEDRIAGVPATELARAREESRSDDERWHSRKDGNVFFCSSVVTKLEGGRGFAKIARDLTGSQEWTQARESLLTREQAGRREAEATVQTKEMLLAVLSHELKHPLNLIHLNAELLTRMPEVRNVPAATRAAGIIQRTVAGQAKIIDDLLDLSRARTGKLKLDRSPVDWCELLRRIVDASRPQAEAAGLRLFYEPTREPLLSLFDPVRADQVVWNLLSNALKFTPRGGSVRVSLADDGDNVRLSISDTGCGMAADYLPHVFDMFSQEPADQRRRDDDRADVGNSGMGIGLALVQELMQAHGGRVQARSDGPGRGSEFTVWAPRHAGTAPPPSPADAPSVLQGLRLLLVDDSPDSVESLGMLLEVIGASVSTATSGAQALELLAQERYDLLISDVSMPGMSGLQLISAVRARESENGGARILALACSGYGRQQDEQRAVEAGFDALVPKPVALEALEHTVFRLRQGSPSA
ncbi:MAG: PAS domain-containing protein [Rubrivivax sp.]|nr:PAS domain-containing protein [Rubrivivax sp.]